MKDIMETYPVNRTSTHSQNEWNKKQRKDELKIIQCLLCCHWWIVKNFIKNSVETLYVGCFGFNYHLCETFKMKSFTLNGNAHF